VNPRSVAERDRPLPGIRTPAQAGGLATMKPPRRARRAPPGRGGRPSPGRETTPDLLPRVGPGTPGLPAAAARARRSTSRIHSWSLRCSPGKSGSSVASNSATIQARSSGASLRASSSSRSVALAMRFIVRGLSGVPRDRGGPRSPIRPSRRARGRRTVGRLRARELHRALVDPSDCLPGSCRPLTWRSPFRTSSRRSRPVGTRRTPAGSSPRAGPSRVSVRSAQRMLIRCSVARRPLGSRLPRGPPAPEDQRLGGA
jgi:hypothetical protein